MGNSVGKGPGGREPDAALSIHLLSKGGPAPAPESGETVGVMGSSVVRRGVMLARPIVTPSLAELLTPPEVLTTLVARTVL